MDSLHTGCVIPLPSMDEIGIWNVISCPSVCCGAFIGVPEMGVVDLLLHLLMELFDNLDLWPISDPDRSISRPVDDSTAPLLTTS